MSGLDGEAGGVRWALPAVEDGRDGRAGEGVCDGRELVLEDRDTARLVDLLRRSAGAERERRFACLYGRYSGRVNVYLRGKFANRADADAVASMLWERVWKGLPGYVAMSRPFRAWLFTLAHHCAVSYVTGENRVEPRDPRELAVLRQSLRSDGEPAHLTLWRPAARAHDGPGWLSDEVLRELYELRVPPVGRRVLLLRFSVGLSVKETARFLERSVRDVERIQATALAILRDGLERAGRAPRVRSQRQWMRMRVRRLPVLRARRFALWGSLPRF